MSRARYVLALYPAQKNQQPAASAESLHERDGDARHVSGRGGDREPHLTGLRVQPTALLIHVEVKREWPAVQAHGDCLLAHRADVDLA